MPILIAPREHAKARVDRAIRDVLDARPTRKHRTGLLAFLHAVQGRSGLLRPVHYQRAADEHQADAIARGLAALHDHRKHWLRPVENWGPRETRPLPLFSSLVHHLVAERPTPPVLLSAWFQGDYFCGHRARRWFLHAARGKSLRTAGFPLKMSRRTAHEFAHAPAHFSIEFALRWAQVRALGGSDQLARAFAQTDLGWNFNHAEFWTSFIQWFISGLGADPNRVGPIVAYLLDQKFDYRPAIIGEDTEIHLGPPQPELSIKGRTIAALWRKAVEWQARRKEETKRVLVRWDRSNIGEYRNCDEQGRHWTIRELLDSDDLAAEGKVMKNCVADYTEACQRRETTIWSIEIEQPEGRKRAATVEANPEKRTIVQARAKCNKALDEPCLTFLKAWADREGLNPEGAWEEIAAAINDG